MAPEPHDAVAPEPHDAVHEVTVQGNKADALKRASGSGITIGQREIKSAQPESTGELLRRVPGLQLRTEDPMGFRLNLGVRGLSPARSRLILMEEDGVPVVVSPYGEPELYYTPLVERIQRLDVIKGSDVLIYGPQTVGAVVQLHTFDPTVKPAWYVASQVGSRAYGAVQARYSGLAAISVTWRKSCARAAMAIATWASTPPTRSARRCSPTPASGSSR
ncbi:MAG: TonB-dependent receptor plug domain-containing protein [Pseudomonadota bacterium]